MANKGRWWLSLRALVTGRLARRKKMEMAKQVVIVTVLPVKTPEGRRWEKMAQSALKRSGYRIRVIEGEFPGLSLDLVQPKGDKTPLWVKNFAHFSLRNRPLVLGVTHRFIGKDGVLEVRQEVVEVPRTSEELLTIVKKYLQ